MEKIIGDGEWEGTLQLQTKCRETTKTVTWEQTLKDNEGRSQGLSGERAFQAQEENSGTGRRNVKALVVACDYYFQGTKQKAVC